MTDDLIARLRETAKLSYPTATPDEAADALEAKDKRIAELESDDAFDRGYRAGLQNGGKTREDLRARIAALEEELLHWKYVRPEMTNTIIAKIMWDAYCVQGGGKTFDGKPLPTWEELGEERQACWIAAAEAARAALEDKND